MNNSHRKFAEIRMPDGHEMHSKCDQRQGATRRLGVTLMVFALSSAAYAEDLSEYSGDLSTEVNALEIYAPPNGVGGGGGKKDTPPPSSGPTYYDWMSPGLETAWTYNGGSYLGQGVTITVVDDFSSRSKYRGDLGDGSNRLRHGEWTLKQASMIAPEATMVMDDFYGAGAISLSSGFNVLNLSYGYTAPLDRALEHSIVAAAEAGTALIAKSAGNDYGNVVGYRADGGYDYLSLALIDTLDNTGNTISATGYNSVLFVGALDWNVVDTNDPLAGMASYSSIAGSNENVQRQFLVVGVEAGTSPYSAGTGLAGTSFAAPIIAGYGAVLSSKFVGATPNQVAGRLLETAREDTILNYNPAIHGQGEADMARAIAPTTIE
ncbi:S8 family serine peptidase [Celeribacter sp. PS-C1]|uniref:S8 family serine peptidase n=1 Tax=Celeribacter sp. PS-C1 TaxID=2820813 RepID=UPI001CA557C9|nr:S8 family serine peptidase [Celeribacter sp. PS-C1]MBW6416386.1 S8 family serine peptidase [Celeribacter sp. PS-C1]